MTEAEKLSIEKIASYLKGEGHSGYIATAVGYEHPVEVTYYAINPLLFEGMPKRMRKSGKQWTVRFSNADEYEIKMNASMLAVVTEYFHDEKIGYSTIHRVEESEDSLLIKPKPDVNILPNQRVSRKYREIDMESESCDGDAIPIVSHNLLRSKNIKKAAKNHDILVDRLLSLEEYNPSLLGTVPIHIDYMIHDKIPLLKPENLL